MSSIDSLEFVASFDNSANNPANPDPDQLVMWGDQTWEEMAVAFVIVAVPRQTETATYPGKPTPEQTAALERYTAFLKQKTDAHVEKYFRRFDANRDDRISKSEYPVSIRRFGRSRTDLNGDGIVTREEVYETAMEYFTAEFPQAAFDPAPGSF
jgi:hypothetical protein